jgi:TolB-like protein/DNA-binding winged helix-turn-helix (wHTH) protein
MEQAAHIAYRFGGFRLDPARRLLFGRDGQMVALKPKAFDTLLYLVEHCGALVERRTLLDSVWPHVVVESNNLDQAISTLRRVLGETRDDHRFIVTEPARGYRFVAPVEVVSSTETDDRCEDSAASLREQSKAPIEPPRESPESQDPPAVNPRNASVRRRRLVPWLAAAAAAVVAVFGLAALRFRDVAATSPVDAVPEISIAVLPFASLSGAGDEYFSDGITEQLISRLGRVPDLKVSAFTSSRFFRDKNELSATIAKLLGVRYLVEGSVRLSDDRLHVNVRLLDPERERVLWQELYDRDRADLIAIQDEIALMVVDRLEVMLLGDARVRFARHPTDNAEAQHLYFLARSLDQGTELEQMNKAIEYYRRATLLDPNFADAFVAWADAVMRRAQVAEVPPEKAVAEGRALISQALKADPDSAEAHAILAFLDHDAGDCDGARTELARAEYFDPNNVQVLIHRSRHGYICDWDPEAALDYARRAEERDPMYPWGSLHVTLAYYHAFQYENALREVDRLAERFQGYWIVYWSRWWILDDLGRYDEALEVALDTVQRNPDNETRTSLAIAYAHVGRLDKARETYDAIVNRHEFWSPAFRALLLLALGKRDDALDAVEEAYEHHDNYLRTMVHMKLFQPLHHDPRFESVVERLQQRAAVDALDKALGV